MPKVEPVGVTKRTNQVGQTKPPKIPQTNAYLASQEPCLETQPTTKTGLVEVAENIADYEKSSWAAEFWDQMKES